jgi:hypothetical protein
MAKSRRWMSPRAGFFYRESALPENGTGQSISTRLAMMAASHESTGSLEGGLRGTTTNPVVVFILWPAD